MFFLSLLIIYIPFPTALLFFQQLAEQHDTITALNKLLLLFCVLLDYYISYHLLKRCQVKASSYLILILMNLGELLVHIYLYQRYGTVNLTIILLFQLFLLFCMFVFPCFKKFRCYIFE
ncbi:hypothetical protein P7E26_06370 [Enterococcus gallinarum]|nr:hypothetical protein [Enterococcus gallinarum]MDT2728733.1 hypothetical protein [Enterococcus gallinarum]